METGPRIMYASQMPAFEARDRALREKTNSTATAPPTRPEPDLEALCRLKREVVTNLPKNCFHCGEEYPSNEVIKGTFVELRDGTVMAYCKKPGACGKSHVLFAGFEFARPIYEQVCLYVRPTKPPAEVIVQRAVNSAEPSMHSGPMSPDELREMHDPTCEACGVGLLRHHRDIDQHGWRVASKQALPKPEGWPEFQASTSTWR